MRKRVRRIAGSGLLAITLGCSMCAGQEVGHQFVPPPAMPSAPIDLEQLSTGGPLMQPEREAGEELAPVIAGQDYATSGATGVMVQTYGLPQLLSMASQHNPTLRQARLQTSAQTARALQAGLYPNPTLNYIGEQIGVDGTAGEFQGMSVEQRFVTAGKLRLSREKYMRRAHVSDHQAMVQRFRVCNDVRIHFFRALAAGEIVSLRRELLKTEEDRAVTARELYNQGQASRAEVRRSNIALQRVRLDVLQAENHYREQFRRLTAVVGANLQLGGLDGSLMPEIAPSSYEEVLATLLAESPELMVARAKLSADGVTLRREQVEWVPDVVARGGAGYNFEAEQTTAVAGISLELPVFDRNQGTIRQAQLDMRRQQQEIRRLELDLQQRLAGTYQQYLTAFQMVMEYDRVIIPEAMLAYEELLESYKKNRVDWPEVLMAQHDYFDVRRTQVEQLELLRENEVLVQGFLLHGGLMAAEAPIPPGHIDAVPQPR